MLVPKITKIDYPSMYNYVYPDNDSKPNDDEDEVILGLV
jgi:hypothetical protein